MGRQSNLYKMKEMIIMNFSGVYERRNFFPSPNEKMEFLDLTDIPGTNGYLDSEAQRGIRQRLDGIGPDGIHFLDSGNYHYATLFWLEKIQEPYELLVFDHHTDMQAPAWGDDLISCGSWIRHALLHDENLQRVFLVGPDADVVEQEIAEEFRGRVFVLPESDIREKLQDGKTEADTYESCISQKDLPIYLSIDKDILSKEEVNTNWDQGLLSLEDLLAALDEVCAGRRVIGVDICGEPPADAADAGLRKSSEVNQALYGQIKYLV